MKKAEAMREIAKYGEEASFLVNVIQCHHNRPARKLKGLLAILQAGINVRIAEFGLDVLLIDGKQANWNVLEFPQVVKDWDRN